MIKIIAAVWLIALTWLCQNVEAQKVTPEEAQTVAMNFASARLNNSFIPYFLDQYTVENEQQTVMYVYNLFPQGFVIVSGEKKTIPVLAYSETSSCPQNGNNPAFRVWLNQYSEKITQAANNNEKADLETAACWNNYLEGNISTPKTQVGPLLTTTWGQDLYYNELCPTDAAGPDDKCVTGCVATAIGQLMNYFRWPQNGTGSYTSEDTVYGPLSVNYGAAEYRYNEMANDLTRTNLETAELIYNIGVSVDMHYGPFGSGMNNHKAAHTMKTFFQYVDSTNYIYRDSVTLNWDSVVVSHLDRGWPMYYAGWGDTNYVSGHAFVVDGYQGTDYFHFNWGWTGSYDGYFYTSSLTPGGSNFTLMHELVINMYPEGTYPYYCNGTDTLRSDDGTIDDGSGPLFGYLNNTDCSWLIQPNDSVQSIQLTFLRFDTETGNDVLTIHDGHDASAPVLGTYSGSSLPSTIQSTGSSLFLHFTSSTADTAAGFLIAYKTISPVFCTTLTSITAESDTINDGSAQFDYHGNNLCRWKIEPASGLPVLLTFTEFDVDSSDYVRIIDQSSGATLGEYKGNQLPPVQFSSNGTLTIYFKSSATAHGDGFTANYRTSPTPVVDLNQMELSVFPNPASEFVSISGITEETHLSIYDAQGNCVYTQVTQPAAQTLVPVFLLENGLYVISATSSTQQASMKFFKQGE